MEARTWERRARRSSSGEEEEETEAAAEEEVGTAAVATRLSSSSATPLLLLLSPAEEAAAGGACLLFLLVVIVVRPLLAAGRLGRGIALAKEGACALEIGCNDDASLVGVVDVRRILCFVSFLDAGSLFLSIRAPSSSAASVAGCTSRLGGGASRENERPREKRRSRRRESGKKSD